MNTPFKYAQFIRKAKIRLNKTKDFQKNRVIIFMFKIFSSSPYLYEL